MQVESFYPSPVLEPFIKDYLVIQSDEATKSRLLPAPAFTLAFRIRGTVSYATGAALPDSIVGAISNSASLLRYHEQSATLVVRFKPTGASAFIRHELHELADSKLSLDHVFTRSAVLAVEERLAGAANHSERIAVVEDFLQTQRQPASTDLLVQHAVNEILASNGIVRIGKLIRQFHTSADPFEKRFRRAVGTTPKHFASIVRLQAVLKAHASCGSLTELAYRSGYFDQSHFIRDFRTMTGLSPRAFFASPGRWSQ